MINKSQILSGAFGAVLSYAVLWSTGLTPDFNERSSHDFDKIGSEIKEELSRMRKVADAIAKDVSDINNVLADPYEQPDDNYSLAATLPPGVLSLYNPGSISQGFRLAAEEAECIAQQALPRCSLEAYDKKQRNFLKQLDGKRYNLDFMTDFVIREVNQGLIGLRVGIVLDPENGENENSKQIQTVKETVQSVVRQHQNDGAHLDAFFALEPSRGLDPGTIVYFVGDQNGLFFDDLEYFERILSDDIIKGKHVSPHEQLVTRPNTPLIN